MSRNHPYLYTGGNPVRFTDPTGMDYLPQWDAYTCDHQGGPDSRDPYSYRLTWGDSIRELYEEGGAVKTRGGSVIAGGYDYRGIPCIVFPGAMPDWEPGHKFGASRPWAWSVNKQKTLMPLFEAFSFGCECTPIPNPVTLFLLEEFYEAGEGPAFEYWDSQQRGWDVRGTPFEETLVGDWYYEQGSAYRVYGPDSLMTRELTQHPSVWEARQGFCQAGCPDRGRYPYNDSLRNPEFRTRTIERNIFDFGNCFLGFDEACANAVLGSRTVVVHNNGDGTATFVISNKTGRASATRSILGEPGMPDKTRAETSWDPNEPNWTPFGLDVTVAGITPGPRGWGGDLWQHYVWVEVMPCCK